MKDLYKILGVAEDASAETIKKAYRKLAKENHPDATGGDKRKTERFKEINEAYGVIGEDSKRKEYDRLRHAPVGADGMPQGFDADAFASVFGQGGGGFRRGNVNVTSDGNIGDLGDLFSSLFGGSSNPWGGGGGGRRTRVPRGQDMLGRLEVPFREAARGTRLNVRSGTGESLEVSVPPGVETGGRLRIPGRGGAAPQGGQPGDLHFEIVVTPDPHLRRVDDDIELDLPLTISEAALGTKVEVPTIDGQVTLTIPPGTSSGARLRLRGKGIKKADGSRSDQIVQVQIVVPKVAPDDKETRRLIEELDKRTRVGPVRNF
jgi:DnaJ-class molecular chaperone